MDGIWSNEPGAVCVWIRYEKDSPRHRRWTVSVGEDVIAEYRWWHEAMEHAEQVSRNRYLPMQHARVGVEHPAALDRPCCPHCGR